MKVFILGSCQSVHVRRWADELEKRGVGVRGLSVGGALSSDPRFEVVLGKFPFNLPLVLWRTWRALRKFRPAIVHCHYLGLYGLIGALTPFQPIVMSAWGSDLLIAARKNFLNRIIFRQILRRAACVFADSRELIEVARKICGREIRTEYVLWGVEFSRTLRRRFSPGQSARRFVSIRMHEPLYRIEQIIDSFAKQASRMPEATLEVAGAGSLTKDLMGRARERGISDRVHFHGLLDESEIRELLSSCDVSISIPRSDGTAMSVLESMAAGLPLICSELPANREWLDEDGAVFIPHGDGQRLSEVIQAFYDGKLDLVGMGERNFQIVSVRANRRTQFDRVLEIYLSLISRPPQGSVAPLNI